MSACPYLDIPYTAHTRPVWQQKSVDAYPGVPVSASITPNPNGHALPQKYRRALDVITQESGLPESAILDIRGNHDVFDMGRR